MDKSLKWRIICIGLVVLFCGFKLIPFKNALNLGLDLQGGTYLTLQVITDELTSDQKKDATDRALEIIRNRIDEFGVSESSIQKGAADRIVIQIPGIGSEGAERIKNIIKQQAHLEFKLVINDEEKLQQAIAGKEFADYELLSEEHVNEMGKKTTTPILVTKTAYVTGEMLEDARVNFSSGGFNEVTVGLEFNKKGARRFGRVTEEHVGERLAIVLDKRVVSAPVIREKILGGNASISGSFSMDEARDLAISLRAGALPAPVRFIQESTVGPTLGADSIRKGVKSAIIGMLMVIIFITFYYLAAGLIANFALFFNVVILLAILSYFHATLTLPGIAGIILTIGMAVDANVLIYERVKEELKLGKSAFAAIKAGYEKAFWSIFDSNITTLLTAVVLFYFGTGPIKGFATTLIIGLTASLFTALFVTRVIFDILFSKFKIKKIYI